ncbi:MAG: radical SAM family heme chaperone HemW [Bdellovibrionales bacterium]
MKSLGIYIHIPYCLQRCRYCDFTTFEQEKILPPGEYTFHLLEEIRNRGCWAPSKAVHSIYFGGGTPSLIDSKFIVSIITEIANAGFELLPDAEVTIEINPATIDPNKLEDYLKVGVNRFSVGAQSFDDKLLNDCGRRHSAEDTRNTLKLLSENHLNYSFDLLFGLPHQSLSQLQKDLEEIDYWKPQHLSAYCLTVPEGHPMSFNRPSDDVQVEMFDVIESQLKQMNLLKYEISNFAVPGKESRHNLTYWQDEPYLSFGLSAHSYFPEYQEHRFGVRFWNPKDFQSYFHQIEHCERAEDLPKEQIEFLKTHESLTDYFHMHLRTHQGLSLDALRKKFGLQWESAIKPIEKLENQGLLLQKDGRLMLSRQGRLVSNQVLSQFTFSEADLTV